MSDRETHAQQLTSSIDVLIRGQRSNLKLYWGLVMLGCVTAFFLFFWSWAQPGAVNVLAVARNVAPLVPSTICVPQIGACICKIAQYKAIVELASSRPDLALKILEQVLSK